VWEREALLRGEELADHLMIKPGEAFNTAHTVANHAEELREELERLSQGWADLSHSWSGTAASAFTPHWEEWHVAAEKLTDMLADDAHKLAEAAVMYEEQDTSAAQTLQTATGEVL
jgi:WXG100 family type VII secretion target